MKFSLFCMFKKKKKIRGHTKNDNEIEGCSSKNNKKMKFSICSMFIKKKKKSSKNKNEVEKEEITQNNRKTALNLCEENSNGTPHKYDNKSDQNFSNELIKVSVSKPGYMDIEESFQSNKTNENKFDENKSNKNKSNEYKFDEHKSGQINSENTKSKIRERKEIFFASFRETQSNENQRSRINKKGTSSSKIIKPRVVEKEMINKCAEEMFNIILERKFSEIKKKVSNDIAAEILYTILSEIILEIAEKKMDNEIINKLIKDVLSNAIHTVSVEKIAIEELFNELVIEFLHEILQQIIWKPLGFANPKGYCYLNSVVQVLGSCNDFKRDIDLYNLNTAETTKDSIFVEGLFDLIKAIRECNKENLNKSLDIVQQNITESSFGDDVYKCFMNLLTRVSNVVKTNTDRPSDHFTKLPINLSEKAKVNFERFKNRNPGFVFDNFYGQLTFQTVCKLCNHICNESFQMIKSLPLPVPNSNTSEILNSCVDLFFNESDVEVDEPMKCNCDGGSTISLKSISKLTHGPKYLFIYLNRGSYTDDGVKNNTHVTCDGLTIDIKALEGESIKYNLISVIDHVGDSSYGHYYCKCSFESEEWWLLNDSQVYRLKDKINIVTKNTIVFFFKKTQ